MGHIHIERFHTALFPVRFVLKARAFRIPRKLLPPDFMGARPGEFFQAFEVAPVLPHADMA
jgi:hypothetical protein